MKRPLPVRSWEGVLDASEYAPACMQLPLQVEGKIYLYYGNVSGDSERLRVSRMQAGESAG